MFGVCSQKISSPREDGRRTCSRAEIITDFEWCCTGENKNYNQTSCKLAGSQIKENYSNWRDPVGNMTCHELDKSSTGEKIEYCTKYGNSINSEFGLTAIEACPGICNIAIEPYIPERHLVGGIGLDLNNIESNINSSQTNRGVGTEETGKKRKKGWKEEKVGRVWWDVWTIGTLQTKGTDLQDQVFEVQRVLFIKQHWNSGIVKV